MKTKETAVRFTRKTDMSYDKKVIEVTYSFDDGISLGEFLEFESSLPLFAPLV